MCIKKFCVDPCHIEHQWVELFSPFTTTVQCSFGSIWTSWNNFSRSLSNKRQLQMVRAYLMTTWSIITNYNFQESPNLKVKPGKGEGGLGLTFKVKKSTMQLHKNGRKVQNICNWPACQLRLFGRQAKAIYFRLMTCPVMGWHRIF